MRLHEFEHHSELTARQQLFDDAFPENRGTPAGSVEHYSWKFRQSPFTPPSFEYAASEDGTMLGYYAALPYRYRIGGRDALAGMVCDVMTHSRARGRGVFTDLGRYALGELSARGVDFVTGYPIRPEVMGGHLRAGWTVAFELPMYIRPLRANAILGSRRLSLLAPFANVGIAAYQRVLSPRVATGYECSVGEPHELFESAAFDAFVEQWSSSVPNHLVKSAEFYRWRLGAPGTGYQAFLVRRGQEVLAAAVGRTTELQGIPSYALLDLMALPDAPPALNALYRAVDAHARGQRAEAVVAMMSKRSAGDYRLLRCGFLKSPFVFKLIVRSLRDAIDPARLADEAAWHLMWIDSDDL